MRLGHQYGPDEDEVLSKAVQVNLAVLMQSQYKVIAVTEKTLSGNQNWHNFVLSKYNWTTPIESSSDNSQQHHHHKTSNGGNDDDSFTVTLHPLEIRTFVIDVETPGTGTTTPDQRFFKEREHTSVTE
jgi:hypothetical protein